MMNRILIGLMATSLAFTSCGDDDDSSTDPDPVTLDKSTLTGGPFTFVVDGDADFVSGITVTTPDNSGTESTFVVTDDELNILGLPPNNEALEGVNFDEAGAGTCLIWYLTFNEGLTGAEVGQNAGDLDGEFALSNSIEVIRKAEPTSAVISGGPFSFDVDGDVDNVSDISIDDPGVGEMSTFVVTDEELNILGLPPTLEALEGVNFDDAGPGVCLIWHLNFLEGIQGAEVGLNAGELMGEFALSNSITVTRNKVTNAGKITSGPYAFQVDGIPDFAADLEVDTTFACGDSSVWVITDDQLNILGLPPTIEKAKEVNFDGAGAGTCLIWYLRYNGTITGAEIGANAADLQGDFDLSNSVEVVRTQNVVPGEISGGPYTFTVDGTPDFATDLSVDSSMATGANSTWVITDDSLNILGLPPTLEEAQKVDFDGAGAGTCLIWYLRFNDGLEGAVMGMNAADLKGEFALSNSITVVRQ